VLCEGHIYGGGERVSVVLVPSRLTILSDIFQKCS
jgi:hypothetical protein